MTGIDSDTSQDIAEAISLKGGRYLEAQIQGSKTQAQVLFSCSDRGSTVLTVAGRHPGGLGGRRPQPLRRLPVVFSGEFNDKIVGKGRDFSLAETESAIVLASLNPRTPNNHPHKLR